VRGRIVCVILVQKDIFFGKNLFKTKQLKKNILHGGDKTKSFGQSYE